MSGFVLLPVPLHALIEEHVRLGELMDVVAQIFEQDAITTTAIVDRLNPPIQRLNPLVYRLHALIQRVKVPVDGHELLLDVGELLAHFGEAGADLVTKC